MYIKSNCFWRITPFPTYGGINPQISPDRSSSMNTRCSVKRGLTLQCPTSRRLIPAGQPKAPPPPACLVRTAARACSKGKQRAPPGCRGTCQKPTNRKHQIFLLPALSCFFSILIVHLFRSFRLLRNTNPSWSFSFVSIHILVLVYCWINGARQIIMEKYTQHILSKEKLFTKMFSPSVTCSYSSNHTGIKLI